MLSLIKHEEERRSCFFILVHPQTVSYLFAHDSQIPQELVLWQELLSSGLSAHRKGQCSNWPLVFVVVQLRFLLVQQHLLFWKGNFSHIRYCWKDNYSYFKFNTVYLLIALCLNHVLFDFCTVCKHLKNCFLKLQSPVLESTTLQLETGLLFICTSNERKENIVLHQIISTSTDFFMFLFFFFCK